MAEKQEVEGLRIERGDGVLRIVLDRPEAKNALSQAMIAKMVPALEAVTDDPQVRVVVITTGNENFCTGMDLAESNRGSQERPRVGNHQRRIAGGPHKLIRAFAEVQLPVVMGVRGWAAGIGLGMALSADIIVADESTRFWAPYVARGFSPDSGTTYLLPRVVGVARAKRILMTGEPFSAAEAVEWGLLGEVAPAAQWQDTLDATVGKLAGAAAVSVGMAKHLVNRNLDADLSAALRNEEFAEEISLRSQDFKEGIAALRERRPTTFTGR